MKNPQTFLFLFVAFICYAILQINLSRIFKACLISLVVSFFIFSPPYISYSSAMAQDTTKKDTYTVRTVTVNWGQGDTTMTIRVCATKPHPNNGNGGEHFLVGDIMVDDIRMKGFDVPPGTLLTVMEDVIFYVNGRKYLLRAGTTATATYENCSSRFKIMRIG